MRCISACELLLPAGTVSQAAALRQLPSLNTETSSSSGASGRLVAPGLLVPTAAGAQLSSPVIGNGSVPQTHRGLFASPRYELSNANGADAVHITLPIPEEVDQVNSSVSNAWTTCMQLWLLRPITGPRCTFRSMLTGWPANVGPFKSAALP